MAASSSIEALIRSYSPAPLLPPSNVRSTPESFCWICKVEIIVVDRSYKENVLQLYVTYKVIHGNCFNRMKGLHSNAHNFRVVSVVIFISDSWNNQKKTSFHYLICAWCFLVIAWVMSLKMYEHTRCTKRKTEREGLGSIVSVLDI